jgi:hypothetical protein
LSRTEQGGFDTEHLLEVLGVFHESVCFRVSNRHFNVNYNASFKDCCVPSTADGDRLLSGVEFNSMDFRYVPFAVGGDSPVGASN